MIGQITILILWFFLYIIFKRVNFYFGAFYVFITFIFAFVVSNREFSSFYLIAYLVAIIMDLALPMVKTDYSNNKVKLGAFEFKGFKFTALCLGIGLIIFIVINQISSSKGNIIGVPNLAISTSSQIGSAFKPTFESSLGIIENQVAFVMFSVLMAFGVLIPLFGILIQLLGVVFPLIISGLIMAIFHVTAYSVDIGLLLFAMGAFMLFIMTEYILKDSLAGDFAHYLNNAVVSLQKGLAIVGV